MVHLDLKAEEQQALIEVLETSISELHTEIMHTKRLEYKSMLKNRKQILLEMLAHLRLVPAG